MPAESQPSMGMINDTCPMSGEPVDKDTSVSYMGYEVGLCCGGCKAGWNQMSSDAKMAKIESYKK